MKDADGVGLAATQVGVLRGCSSSAPEEDQVATVVNPQIVKPGEERTPTTRAACRSGGDRAGRATDHRDASRGATSAATRSRFELEGMAARVVQHELDHLDGMLILDRTTPEARREAIVARSVRAVGPVLK